jgi:small subunit ribosomal protein S8e
MKSKRKTTGGRSRTQRRSTKKLAWRGGIFSETKLSDLKEEKRVVLNGRGNSIKVKLRHALNANVFDSSANKTFKAKILTIVENNANRQFARRNIITKGAILEVDLNGKKYAKVTSRPGQNGVINAVLVDATEIKTKKQKEETTAKIQEKPESKEKENQKEAKEKKPTEKESKPEKQQ